MNNEKFNLRFNLNEEKNIIALVDEDNILQLNHQFNSNDKEWLSSLTDFLNKQDIIMHDVILKYGECVDEINDFRAKIIHTLQEEIRDCEQLIMIDKNDQYAHGRLVELHNLIKILL